MKKLVYAILFFASATSWAALEEATQCLQSLDQRLNISASKKVFALDEGDLRQGSLWHSEKFSKLVLQKQERSLIFSPKLAEGKNRIVLFDNKGEEQAQVCLEKRGSFVYIQSVNEECQELMSESVKKPAYAQVSYENLDLLGDQIHLRLERLNQNLAKNLNVKKCEQFVSIYRSCADSYNQLTGSRNIASAENRYQFSLRRLRARLQKSCKS